VLKHAGLKATLAALCAELRTDDIDCAFTGAGDFDGIDQTAALCLFRISQEALNNVIKHAAARHVVVRLVRTDGVAELTIDDDGRGFDASRVRARGTGLGLAGMSERARLAGGTVTIGAEPGRGTRVLVRIPLHPHTV
jgi:signal transduction histidine kinase